MKIRLERKHLLSAIQRVAGVVEARNSMPILSHVLIQAYAAEEDVVNTPRLSFFATDLELGLYCDAPAQVERSGRITLSAKKLLEIVHALPEGSVELEQIDQHWVSVLSGNAQFKIAGLPPEEFPSFTLPEGDSKITIDPKLLSILIKKVFFAMGESDPRYIFNGILFHLQKMSGAKSMLRLVSTDGHRLAMAEGMIKSPKEWPPEESVILPKKAVLEIRRFLEDARPKERGATPAKEESVSTTNEEGAKPEREMEMTLGKGTVSLKYGTTLLTSRLMFGSYPNYQQVIPKDNDKKVTVNKELLTEALGRVSLFSHEKTHAVQMRVGTGEMVLQSNNPEIGEAREQIPLSFSGESFVTLFSARYLTDLLAVLDSEEAVFEFRDPQTSCLIREDFHWSVGAAGTAGRETGKFLSIIMPIKEQ
jgi:DNA polymerase-3 subunit beta